MIKHKAGQYICGVCQSKYQTKQTLNEHESECHKKQTEKSTCTVCGQTFANEHSLKQHNTSKHKTSTTLPVGHPDRAKDKNKSKDSYENKSADIACIQCGQRFSTGKEIDEHMQKHKEEETNGKFEEYKESRICRYHKRGVCNKGRLCKFVHNNQERHFAPPCSKGQSCFFLKQNRCNFFHPGVGVQNPRMHSIPQEQTFGQYRECRYQNDCWNVETCPFMHSGKGFQFVQKTNRPPMGAKQRNSWMNY